MNLTPEEIENRIEKRLKFVKENHGKMNDAQMAN